MEKNNAVNFLKFLKKIYRKYPKKHLHVIADNLNVHKHKDVIKGAVWHSKEQLAEQIINYVDAYNKERAKPFEWTYDGKKKINSANIKSSH